MDDEPKSDKIKKWNNFKATLSPFFEGNDSTSDDDGHLGVVRVHDEPKRSDRGLLCSGRPSIAAASSNSGDDHLVMIR